MQRARVRGANSPRRVLMFFFVPVGHPGMVALVPWHRQLRVSYASGVLASFFFALPQRSLIMESKEAPSASPPAPSSASSCSTGTAACGELTIERSTARKSSVHQAASLNATIRRPLEMSVIAACTTASQPASKPRSAQQQIQSSASGHTRLTKLPATKFGHLQSAASQIPWVAAAYFVHALPRFDRARRQFAELHDVIEKVRARLLAGQVAHHERGAE